jgi:2-succinyl-5-enolpyruvyl-6-hydroxy-3-cyclohexene-1-carboxylate synthase
VFGHPTLSRQVPALVKRAGVELIVVRSGGEDWNPTRGATVVDAVEVVGVVDPASRSWLGRWVQASRDALETDDSARVAAAISDAPADQARFNRDVLRSLRERVSRRSLVEAVWRFTWPHDRLVLGASRLIREADAVVPGKKIPVFANRGLAGIDGTIATATGIALASQAKEGSSSAGITRVLLGDLALLHDVGSLARLTGEPRPRMQVIVGDDHGGTIFDSLEVRGTADEAAFDRVMLTPSEVDYRALATAFGWDYVLAADRGTLEDALAPTLSPRIIHVPLER